MAAESNIYGIIILDVMLPGMSGHAGSILFPAAVFPLAGRRSGAGKSGLARYYDIVPLRAV